MMAEVVPDDPEVLAYVGRCYARTGSWNESDIAFTDAIDAANRAGQPSWWIYRDWGHINARFRRVEQAEQHLSVAAQMHPRDASIWACYASLEFRRNNLAKAREYYE